MSEDEYLILQYCMDGLTFEEIGIRMGLTVEEIQQIGNAFWNRAFEAKRKSVV